MATKAVHCPVCKTEQLELANEDGELMVKTPRGWMTITGFICAGCGRVIHWKVRRPVATAPTPRVSTVE